MTRTASGGTSELGPEISCEPLGARCMQVRGLRVLPLAVTPHRTQTVHLPIGFFRPRFLLQINLSSFLQEWLAFCTGEEGVAGFLCLCPEGSTHLDTVGPGVVAWVRRGPWGHLALGTGWGSVWRENDARPPTRCLQAGRGHRFPVQRPVTTPQQLSEAAISSSVWMGCNPQPCYLGMSFTS